MEIDKIRVLIEKKERKPGWNDHGKHNVGNNGGKKSKEKTREKICPRCKNHASVGTRCPVCRKIYH